jgi:hypothetical protein
MSLDQTNDSEAKRERVAESSRMRSAANSNQARKKKKKKAVEPVDQERLIKAIRYLKEHPSAK